jgi:hypothetical protein
MTAILILVAIQAAGGALFCSFKGRTGLGLTLGLFLGIIGWIILAFIPPTYAKQVERETTRRQVSQAADDAEQGKEAMPGTLENVTPLQIRNMTPAERKTYVKEGRIPSRFLT